MRRFIMSFGSTAVDDEEAGAGAGVGEGVEEREGTKIGVDGRDMVVVKNEEEEQRKQRRVAGKMGVVEGPLLYLRSSSRSGVGSHVFLENFRGMEVLVVDPRVVQMRVACPMHEVLQLTSSPMSPSLEDGLDFVFFFTIDDWRRACEGRSICLRLLIR